MENMKKELILKMQDVFDDVKMSSTILEAGKEVAAHRQLQGVRTKLVNLIEWISKELPDQDVAETNPKTE